MKKISSIKNNIINKEEKYIWKTFNLISKQDYKEAFEKQGLGNKWDFFENLVKPEIRIKLISTPEENLKIGQSKIGGSPDLPMNIEWPKQKDGKHLSFLGQINFSELKNDELLSLPDQGIIYFFSTEDEEKYGFLKENSDDFRVIYSSETSFLERRKIPSKLQRLKNNMYRSCKLQFTNSYSLPCDSHDFVTEKLTRIEVDPYINIIKSFLPNTKLFGHSINMQEAMEYECEMIDRGYYWIDVPEKEKMEIRKVQYQWKLLFQLDSEDEADMMWGDGGKFYFWIKENDLLERNFYKTWLILQY